MVTRGVPASPGVGAALGIVRLADASAELWHAWVGRHAADVDALTTQVLSPDERAHRARYRSRDAAERYVVTRALVRQVLSRRLGVRPDVLALGRTDTGKPTVDGGMHFSISHSGELILLAVSADRQVGVDVERRRPVPRVEDLSRRWLTPRERDELRHGAARESASDAFLRVWTAKEARLKAVGVGISGASLELGDMPAASLDDVLSGCVDHAGAHYLGAIAFA